MKLKKKTQKNTKPLILLVKTTCHLDNDYHVMLLLPSMTQVSDAGESLTGMVHEKILSGG